MASASPLVAEWGEHQGEACIRVSGAGAGELVRATRLHVYPTEVVGDGNARLPPMAGRCGADRGGAWFVPRFGFVPGTSYTVVWDEQAVVLERPADNGAATTTVCDIYPSASTIPVNQLRIYVHFSAPMSEGFAAENVRVVDTTSGEHLPDALLEATAELWDRDRRRLTLMFDPGRIKRGLMPHLEAGYPLCVGRPIEVVVGAAFPDARGRPLVCPSARRYEVGPEVREHVGPARWALHPPAALTSAPLVVDFDRSLDHGLLQHALTVHGPGGSGVPGSVGTGPEERSWAFFPTQPWAPGAHQLRVDPRLEDLAGNSVSRVFDRDLSDPRDDPRPARAVSLTFDVT